MLPASGLTIPMPNIVNYFDPRNMNHLKAYDELIKTGRWPNGFGDGVYHPPGWSAMITDKVAQAWVHHAMEVGGLKQKLHVAKMKLSGLNDHRAEVETAVAVMGEVEHTMLS